MDGWGDKFGNKAFINLIVVSKNIDGSGIHIDNPKKNILKRQIAKKIGVDCWGEYPALTINMIATKNSNTEILQLFVSIRLLIGTFASELILIIGRWSWLLLSSECRCTCVVSV